ncbi:MAG: sterol carrier family protein [Propionibacteriaceae bacterium]|nr:sterol carrier family protein [Propionibacteriaceae bacterium]
MGVVAQRTAVRGIIDLGGRLSDLLISLSHEDFTRSVPSTDLTVHQVTAGLLVTQTTLVTALALPTLQRPSPLADYCAGLSIARHRTEGLAQEIADHDSGPALSTNLQHAHHDLAQRLSGSDLPDVVAIDRSALRTVDLLRLVGQTWVLHADDLNRALPGHRPVDIPRSALADAVRLFADVLRRQHPGQSVEIRIPPFAAIQCGNPGEPRHTRGTPPTVIEAGPLPFIRLCRGRETWADSLRDRHVTASGVRADISDWLPLY